jgi:prepilin-type N-terminal cleavage/methylation domain-containing protein
MRWAAADDAGFALIEILVSAVIVALISAAVADALISSAHLSGTERQRSQADQLVQQDQERLKGLSDQQLQGLTQTRTVKLDGYTYTVTSNSTFEGTSGASSCSSGSAAYFKVASTVTGQPTGTITDESIIRRTVDGGLRVQVDDESALNPLSGVPVTATGPSTATGTTDANGCFVFTGMTPGNYSVGVAAAGYVDKDGYSSPPGISATVSATGIAPTSNTPLSIGKGGSITASFATSTTTQTFAVPGYYLSYFGSLGIGKMSAAPPPLGSGAPVTSIPTASQHLFPFTTLQGSTYSYTGNYQVWAGKCASEQPLSPPPGIDIATVAPGSAAAATVGEPALEAAITGNTAPLDVKITYSDGSCADVWSPVAAVGTDAANGSALVFPAPFASNAAKGDPASNVPGVASSVTLCVDYKSGTKWHTKTFPATTTSFTAPTVVTSGPFDLSTTSLVSTPC